MTSKYSFICYVQRDFWGEQRSREQRGGTDPTFSEGSHALNSRYCLAAKVFCAAQLNRTGADADTMKVVFQLCCSTFASGRENVIMVMFPHEHSLIQVLQPHALLKLFQVSSCYFSPCFYEMQLNYSDDAHLTIMFLNTA